MQAKGYHQPTFTIADDHLIVIPGEKTIVQSFVIAKDDESKLEIDRKRKVVGQTLTPSLLNEVESWASLKLQSNGYPCPQISSTADGTNGVITLNTEPGNHYVYNKIKHQELDDLKAGVLERFYAFQEGDAYDWLLKPFNHKTHGRIWHCAKCAFDNSVPRK